jgi:PTS system nitrogen regulatory IIA component
MLDFVQLLDVSRIKANHALSSKKRTLETLAQLLAPFAEEHSQMEILDALSARERLGSTGLGHGIGLPHGRMENLKTPIAAIITSPQGIDFDAPDDQPVDIIFALLMPQQCNEEHLKILANLAKLFIQEDLRLALRQSKNAEQLFKTFIEWPSAES